METPGGEQVSAFHLPVRILSRHGWKAGRHTVSRSLLPSRQVRAC